MKEKSPFNNRLGEVKRPEYMHTSNLVDFMLSIQKPMRRETASSVDGLDDLASRSMLLQMNVKNGEHKNLNLTSEGDGTYIPKLTTLSNRELTNNINMQRSSSIKKRTSSIS